MRVGNAATMALVVVVAMSSAVFGQDGSPASLRQELNEARRENAALRARIEALQGKHEVALAEVDRLRRVLARGSGDGGGGEPTVGGLPAGNDGAGAEGVGASGTDGVGGLDPYSSPGALFVAASVSYNDRIWEGAPEGAGKDWMPEPGAVRAWTAEIRRALRGRSEWLCRVRLVKMEHGAVGQWAMVTILDRQTLEPVEGAFAVEMPERFVERFEGARVGANADGGGEPLFELLVDVGAAPVFQAGRDRRGPFNYPRFIGPFAGFGFDVVIRGVGEISVDEARARAAEIPEGSGRR